MENFVGVPDSTMKHFVEQGFKKNKILRIKYSTKKVTNSATVPSKKVIFSTYCVDK